MSASQRYRLTLMTAMGPHRDSDLSSSTAREQEAIESGDLPDAIRDLLEFGCEFPATLGGLAGHRRISHGLRFVRARVGEHGGARKVAGVTGIIQVLARKPEPVGECARPGRMFPQFGEVIVGVKGLGKQHAPALLEQHHSSLGIPGLHRAGRGVAGDPGEAPEPVLGVAALQFAGDKLGQQFDSGGESGQCFLTGSDQHSEPAPLGGGLDSQLGWRRHQACRSLIGADGFPQEGLVLVVREPEPQSAAEVDQKPGLADVSLGCPLDGLAQAAGDLGQRAGIPGTLD